MKAICVLSVCVLMGLSTLRFAHGEVSATPAAAPPLDVGPTELVA